MNYQRGQIINNAPYLGAIRTVRAKQANGTRAGRQMRYATVVATPTPSRGAHSHRMA